MQFCYVEYDGDKVFCSDRVSVLKKQLRAV